MRFGGCMPGPCLPSCRGESSNRSPAGTCFGLGIHFPPQRVFLGVGRLGILIARHLKRLERVILGYLEVCDGPEEEARLGILETLQCTIEHAWPRYWSGMKDTVESVS